MTTTLLLTVALAASTLLPDGGEPSGFVTADGGDVPVVAPGMTPGAAKVVAPELVSDGGQTADGGQAPTLAAPELSVYDVNLPAEAALTAGFFGLYFMADILVKPTLKGDVGCRTPAGNGQCNASDLTAFDRYAVGKVSPQWGAFSDVALYTSLTLPVLYLGFESLALPTRHPWGDFANDLLVVAESLALTASVNTVLKFAFRRPRPGRYQLLDASTSFDQELSFPSGHASMVSAATTALTTTFFMRHPDSAVRFVFLGAGAALTVLTAIARVENGSHFPTDVMTGVLVGAAAGFAVPFLHKKASVVRPSVAFSPSTGSTMLVFSGDW